MPWIIRKGKGNKPYKIVKKTTGKIVGSSVSKNDAMKSISARYASESGQKVKKS